MTDAENIKRKNYIEQNKKRTLSPLFFPAVLRPFFVMLNLKNSKAKGFCPVSVHVF